MKISSFRPDTTGYPELLRMTPSPPETIYVSGEIKNADTLAVAIVGSRTASAYGKKTAETFAFELAKQGVTIVSGLARGIDTVAHLSALNAGGRTIAVIGSGLDIIYPPENDDLARQIVKNGALVSEFNPGTKPLPENFLQRNRVVAGLSLAVIIIEGRRRSGTLSTARHAAEAGREVFAVPGPIDSPLSEAPLYLIEQGAQVAKSPEQVLDYIKSAKAMYKS